MNRKEGSHRILNNLLISTLLSYIRLIEAEMDRLNPDDMTPDYSITPDEDDEEADEGESEGNFIEDDFDEGVEE